jgi:nucleoside-diphosphate-sugar epimerase
MVKALVTGANGFVAAHLIPALLSRGYEVRGLVRRAPSSGYLHSLGIELVAGDVTDAKSLLPAVAGTDVVFHLAGLTKALTAGEFMRVNAQGVANIADACAAQPTPPVLVTTSSLAAAGPAPNGRLRTEIDPPAPVSKYGISKRAGELEAQARADKLAITVVRPPIIFGEHDIHTEYMFGPIARKGLHAVVGLGPWHFSLIHAADLAQGLILAAEKGKRILPQNQCGADAPGFYFFADDPQPTYPELGRMIGRAVGRSYVQMVKFPRPIAYIVASICEIFFRLRRRPGIVNIDKVIEATAGSWVCSAERARAELGFCIGAPLADRLKQTADWFAARGCW